MYAPTTILIEIMLPVKSLWEAALWRSQEVHCGANRPRHSWITG